MDEGTPHARLEELIAIDVLGGLDRPEREDLDRALAEHGPGCAECQRIRREYSEAAGALALLPDPVPVTGEQEARLVAAATARGGGAPAPGVAADPRERRFHRRLATTIAIAAALALGLVAGLTIAPGPRAGEAAFVSFAAHPDTRLAPMSGSNGQRLTVAYRPGEVPGWVFGSRLATPNGDQVYELWYRTSADSPMRPAGIFVPDEGSVVAPVTLGRTIQAFAVSVEPAGGSRSPTSAPVFFTTVA